MVQRLSVRRSWMDLGLLVTQQLLSELRLLMEPKLLVKRLLTPVVPPFMVWSTERMWRARLLRMQAT